MSATALDLVQEALVQRLKGSPEVAALVTGIHDAVPDQAAKPYVVYDEATESPSRTFGANGHTIVCTLAVYIADGARTRGGRGAAGFREGTRIAGAIARELLEVDPPLAVPGHHVVDVDVERIDLVREDEAGGRRVDVTLFFDLEDAA